MESIETKNNPNQPEPSSAIRELVVTDTNIQMLQAAFCGLRRRKDALYLELKKPGMAADKPRLRELLTELERIARALRGRNANLETPSGDEHISSIVTRVMAQWAAELGYEGTR
jgi:hypothetical protein